MEYSLVFLEYGEIVLPPLTVMVNSNMNLTNGLYHKCKRGIILLTLEYLKITLKLLAYFLNLVKYRQYYHIWTNANQPLNLG